jgi:hypothetical protein
VAEAQSGNDSAAWVVWERIGLLDRPEVNWNHRATIIDALGQCECMVELFNSALQTGDVAIYGLHRSIVHDCREYPAFMSMARARG